MLFIDYKGSFIIGLKLFGKLQYVLLNFLFVKFKRKYYYIDIKSSESSKSEGDYTRLFVDNPQQLYDIKMYFISKK